MLDWTKTKALVERDKVDLLLSELVSSVGAAMAPYVTEQKVPWISTVALDESHPRLGLGQSNIRTTCAVLIKQFNFPSRVGLFPRRRPA